MRLYPLDLRTLERLRRERTMASVRRKLMDHGGRLRKGHNWELDSFVTFYHCVVVRTLFQTWLACAVPFQAAGSRSDMSRLWPAGARRLPEEVITACFSRATAVCGPWASTSMASWATARTALPLTPMEPTAPSRLWPAGSRRSPQEVIT